MTQMKVSPFQKFECEFLQDFAPERQLDMQEEPYLRAADLGSREPWLQNISNS